MGASAFPHRRLHFYGAELPAVVPFQPMPRHTSIIRNFDGPTTTTTVMRIWDPADRGRCRLCPSRLCCLSPEPDNSCMIQFPRYVDDHEAWSISCDDSGGTKAPQADEPA